MRRRLLALTLALLLPLSAADAKPGRDQDRARDAVRSGEVLPLEQILPRVRGQNPGRLLDVELQRSRGTWIYRIKTLGGDGQVRVTIVDARTGRILRSGR